MMRRRDRSTTLRRLTAVLLAAGVVGAGCFLSPDPYPGVDPSTGDPGACTPGSTEACYTGPAGTEGQGLCRAGTRSCGADARWGACEGEVLPAEEDCGTGQADEDCDGSGWFTDGDADCVCEPGVTEACYTGPEGTEGVGACHGGTWACNPNGRGHGPCLGEVLPATAEVCDNNVPDDTCDGLACSGEVAWAIQAEGTGTQEAYDVAVDSGGNVLVAGRFQDTLKLGENTITSTGFDGFVLKLSPAGGVAWVKQLGGDGDQVVRGVAVDGNDNVYVTGHFDQALTIDMASPLMTEGAGDVDFFVAKLDPDGALAWATDYGTGTGDDAGDDQVALSIAVNGEDNVAITGWSNGVVSYVDAGGMTMTPTSAGGRDIFVAGIGPAGAMRWFRMFGDDREQTGRKVALGNAVYVTGDGLGSFDVGTTGFDLGLTYADILSVGLDPLTGDPAFAHNFEAGMNNARGFDVALVSGGELLLAGYYAGTLDLGGGPFVSTGQSRFVTRRDSNGGHIWSKGFAAPTTSPTSADVRMGIAVDTSGNVLLTGEFSDTASFAGAPLVSAGGGDIYVVKLDPAGDHVWSRRFGDAQHQYAYAVAADPTGHAVITGNFLGQVDFGVTTLDANGADLTLFVAKLAP